MDDNDDSKFIYWEVEDNGIGIKDEHKEKYLKIFIQVKNREQDWVLAFVKNY